MTNLALDESSPEVNRNGVATLVDELDALFVEQGPAGATASHLVSTLRKFRTSWPNVLEEAGQDSWLTTSTRGPSFNHNNGFTKVSLHKSQVHGYQLRLHIWWERDAADSAIHSHRWDFGSLILVGTLLSRNYRVVSHTRSPSFPIFRYEYSDAKDSGAKSAAFRGETRLEESCLHILSAGSLHGLLYSEPHRVFNHGAGITASLIVTAPPCTDVSSVFKEERLETDQVTQPRNLAIEEEQAAIHRLLQVS